MTQTLGMRWGEDAVPSRNGHKPKPTLVVNTRTSLWPERWPAIALEACIEQVEAAPPEKQAEVKFALPCQDCSESSRCLNAKSKELGSLMYSREILTHPRSSDSSLFPRTLVEQGYLRGEPLVPFWRKPFSLEHEYAVVQAWDIAWSEKTGGDYLVNMTGYVHLKTGRRRLLDISRWQRKTFDEQMKMIPEQREKYGPADLVVIETDAAQQIWKQHIERNTSVPVVGHDASGKRSLAMGVPSLLILLENRKWEFPYGDVGSYHREEMDNFVDELEAFGWVDGKLEGVGEHDDTVMCWWHLNWGMDKYVSSATQGGNEFYRGMQDGASH